MGEWPHHVCSHNVRTVFCYTASWESANESQLCCSANKYHGNALETFKTIYQIAVDKTVTRQNGTNCSTEEDSHISFSESSLCKSMLSTGLVFCKVYLPDPAFPRSRHVAKTKAA